MTEAEERLAVVAEARSWVGTPYHNCADLKGIGVDCGMLIVRVFVDCGLCPPFDPRPYPPNWHMHRNEEKYLGFVRTHCGEIKEDNAQSGDIVVFRFGRCFAHGGILTSGDPIEFIHALQLAHGVIGERLSRNKFLLNRPRLYFSYWGAHVDLPLERE